MVKAVKSECENSKLSSTTFERISTTARSLMLIYVVIMNRNPLNSTYPRSKFKYFSLGNSVNILVDKYLGFRKRVWEKWMCIYIYLKIFTVYIYDHFDSFLSEKKSINEIIVNQRSSFIIHAAQFFIT